MVGLIRIAVAAVLLLPASPLKAEPDDAQAAKTLFDVGVELTRQENWQGALARFEASRKLVERPSTLYNLATVLLHLARYVEAAEVLKRYLKLTAGHPQDSLRHAAKRKLQTTRATIAIVTLELDPSHAEITIDGSLQSGRGSPRRLHLDPGKHRIEATAKGYRPHRFDLRVGRGERRTHRLALSPLSSPRAESGPTRPLPAVVSTTQERRSAVSTEGDSWFESPIFWIVTGAVVAGAIAGGVILTRSDTAPYGGSTGDTIEALRRHP